MSVGGSSWKLGSVFFYSFIENITHARWGHLKMPKRVEPMYELGQRMTHHQLKSGCKNCSVRRPAVEVEAVQEAPL
jgi:hypothetical protein